MANLLLVGPDFVFLSLIWNKTISYFINRELRPSSKLNEIHMLYCVITTGNSTEWSPVQSAVMGVMTDLHG